MMSSTLVDFGPISSVYPPQPVTKFCFGNPPCHPLMVGQSGFPPVLLEWYFLMLALQDMGVIIQ